jgi:hybrid cluster-associated redox disulfide protein
MSLDSLTADTTIAQALRDNPNIAAAFVSRRTACVGCYLARFCTLRDAASAYELPLDAFLHELKKAIPDRIVSHGGTNA